MLCQICKENNATIHLTEIEQGQRTETHLCQQCAQKQGLAVQSQIPLNELLSNLLAAAKNVAAEPQSPASAFSQPDKPCPTCGMTLRKFSETSLLGCPDDYKHFQNELTPLIERTHAGHGQHCGKVPSQSGQQMKNEVELLRLRQQLEQAIKSENYEMAASLRDQIRQIQS